MPIMNTLWTPFAVVHDEKVHRSPVFVLGEQRTKISQYSPLNLTIKGEGPDMLTASHFPNQLTASNPQHRQQPHRHLHQQYY